LAIEQQELNRVVRAVFGAWQRAGIHFLVLRNYERLPHFTTNDIDVLIGAAQLGAAEAALVAAAHAAGFRLHNRSEFAATLALYISGLESNAQAHFDLYTGFRWRGLDFLDCRAILDRKVNRGLFAIPHPAHEAAASLLENLVYHGKVKEQYRSLIAAGFRAEVIEALELLGRTWGAAQAAFLVAMGAAEQWAGIEARSGALRRALILRQAFRRPCRTAASLLADAARFARRAARPPGLTVVLCGADGSGKSTAARAIIEGLRPTFSPQRGREFHWKPPLFSARRRAERGLITDPHAEPPRNRLVSLLFFGFHWLEFFLGWPLCVQPAAFRGGLVLIDRFYYDFFVDQRRYRLRVPRWLVGLGYRFLAKPHLVLLLDAPVEVLQSRKQEVPPAETHRQRMAYLELVRGLTNGRIIDAAQPPEKVAAQIERVVLDFLAQRVSRRNRSTGI
jgi:thymidylate kinase